MCGTAYIVLIPLNLCSRNRIQGDTTYFHISTRLFGYVTFPRSSVLSRSLPYLPPSSTPRPLPSLCANSARAAPPTPDERTGTSQREALIHEREDLSPRTRILNFPPCDTGNAGAGGAFYVITWCLRHIIKLDNWIETFRHVGQSAEAF